MQLFQFADEGVIIVVREFGCRRRRACLAVVGRRRKESQTFRLTGGFFIWRLVTSSPAFHKPPHVVQHVQRPAWWGRAAALPGMAAQQRRPSTISFNGLTRRNLARTSAAGAPAHRPVRCSSLGEGGSILRRWNPASGDDGEAGFGRDPIQGDVATNPARPPRRGRERLSAFAVLPSSSRIAGLRRDKSARQAT